MKNLRVLLAVLCALAMVIALAPASIAEATPNLNPPVVETKNGKLMGYMNGDIYAFAGIQYATAGRFEEPKAVEPWEGVKAAQSYGAICPVPEQTAVGADEFVWPHRYWPQNENCQFLNIWTKAPDASAKKPVMVFLHGGGYTNGSSIEGVAYDGKNLSEYGDVVVVTLNHRLNVLGYLDLSAYGDEYKESANVGFADIVMALQWIHDNIEAFGGDPSNVTIFGQSGGGGKVLTMMHMPSAKGLFERAISESSGSGVNYGKITKEMAQKVAAYTLQNLGMDGSQITDLKTVPYDDLINAANTAIAQCKKDDPDNASYYGWGPVPDDDYMMKDFCDWAKDMPFMTGSVFSEQTSTLVTGDGRKNEWTAEEVSANLKEKFGDKADAVVAEFTKLFPNKKPQDVYFYSSNGRNNILKVGDLKRAAGGPLYEYLFAFELPVNGGTTAFHCSELTFVFHNVGLPLCTIGTGGTEECFKLQDIVSRAWINFATNGDPSQEGLEWKPYTDEGKETMVFDVNSELKSFDDSGLRELMPVQ